MKSNKSNKDLLLQYKKYLPLVVFVFSGLLYINTWNHLFALDDYSIILEHQHVKNGWNGIWDILTTNYRNGQQGFNDGLYRPLSLVSFAIEQALFEGNPRVSHILNILFYAFSCMLLFVGLQKVLKHYPLVVPLAAVLIFAAHPLHTEVVANIKGRDELFSLLGFTSCLLLALQLLQKKESKYWLIIVVSYLFALFSKESSVVYFVAIPLILLLNSELNKKKILQLGLILSILSVGFFFLRIYIINSMPNPVDPGNFGILNNPIAASSDQSIKWGSTFSLQLFFIKKLLLPLTLIHDYSFNQIPLTPIFGLSSLAGIFILILLVVVGIRGYLKKNPIAYLITLYLILILLPAQLLMNVGVHFAERLLFMPVLAFSLLVVFLIAAFRKKDLIKMQKGLILVTVLLIVPYTAITIDRNKDWKNNLSLYEADIDKASNSARANYNLGTELSELANLSANTLESQALLQRSKNYLVKAISIYPDYMDAINNLGIVYKELNQPAQAVELYLNSIRKDPSYNKNYYNLATSYYELKQFENCILSMQEYVDRVPNNASAYLIMGQSAGNLNQFKRATSFLNQCLNVEPNNVEALNFLGMAYGIQNEYINAERIFLKILELKPNDQQSLLNLSINYHQQGKLELEVASLQRLLNLYPNNQAALNQIVLTLEALGRSDEAQKYRSRLQ